MSKSIPKTGSLEAIYSKMDFAGNCNFALRYTDFATGKVVEGTISGGEANIYGILRHWNTPNDWDRTVEFSSKEMAIRKFNRMVKDWPNLGCTSETLAKAIKENLA